MYAACQNGNVVNKKVAASSRNQEVLAMRGRGRSVSVDAKCILISGLKRNSRLISSLRTQILGGSF